jgi:hypothetical protein
MRRLILGSAEFLLILIAACGGGDSSASGLVAGGGTSGSDASTTDANSNTGGAAGGSSGGAGVSAAGSSGANVGTGGSAGSRVVDASLPGDSAAGPKKDGGRTGADGGCTQTAEDKCDTCTEKHCCAQLDACDANSTCASAYAAIDKCIGDSSSGATAKQCYKTFGETQGSGQSAKNLFDCVVAQCAAQCHP